MYNRKQSLASSFIGVSHIDLFLDIVLHYLNIQLIENEIFCLNLQRIILQKNLCLLHDISIQILNKMSSDFADTIAQLIKFRESAVVDDLKMTLQNKSMLEILGIGRKETCHSQFLSWLFNPNESHGLRMKPLDRLLLLLASSNNFIPSTVSVQEKRTIQSAILTGSLNIIDANLNTEVWTNLSSTQKNSDGRVDIVIDIRINPIKTDTARTIDILRIVIENKIFSKEHGKNKDQTMVYHKYFETNNKNNELCIYVFLTPIGFSEECACAEHFIHITYQDILDKILMPALKSISISTRTHFILEEYINNLSITTDSKNSIPMAMTEEQKELLIKFWDENKDLIIASVTALAETENVEEQEELQRTAEALNKAKKTRHNMKFIFTYNEKDYNDPKGQGRLVHAIIQTYVTEKSPSLTELEKAFPSKLQNERAKKDPLGCFKKISDIESNKQSRYFIDAPILVSGEKIAVCSQWGTYDDESGEPTKGNFPQFKKNAENLGFKIRCIKK